ncbi:DUF1963 domain-containing protein [Amycolatopsis jejuensis]|uniref:DUF1963 domain-containing protein n=1 Tax=Amycolatopsis jejuensis TaxID=330084 RepID=UPI00068EF81D|nr:DUF1963 domain-containing protein [Amycolatopsis jejuensis]
MIPTELKERLSPFRDEALRRDLPANDVDRWLSEARACATLTHGEGPVVARFGGPLLLPPDAEDPWFPLVATLDLATFPEGSTGLPLPRDGHLLLFAFPAFDDPGTPASDGAVRYLPAGTELRERAQNPYFYGPDSSYRELSEAYPQGDLHLAADVSLPYAGFVEIPDPPYERPLPGHPRSEELAGVWLDTCGEITADGPLQIGGYATDESGGDPVRGAAEFAAEAEKAGNRAKSAVSSGWVLLASWSPDISGWEGMQIHWSIPEADLSAGRFERAYTTFYWNP